MNEKSKLSILISLSMILLMIGTAYPTFLTGSNVEIGPDNIGDTKGKENAENGVKNTRSNEELRQLSNNYGQIRGGFNTHGFIDSDESNGHVFYHNSYRESTVYRYTSLANFINNNGAQQMNLPRQSEGTYHCVYRSHFYYAAYSSNTLVKCRTTDMGQVLTRVLPGAGFHNRAHFNWGGYTDINLMSDETGLYVCWATSTSASMQLSQLDENLNVLKTWNTGRNKGNVGWAFMVGGVLYWGNSYNSATFNYKYDTSTSTQSTYSNSLGAGGYITHTSYNADDNSLLVWNQGTVYRYPEIGGVRITNVESAALKGTEDDGKVCYAGYRSYNISVNVTTTETLDDASELEVWLDYNTTNATLGFNWSRQEFFKLQDENRHVYLLAEHCSFSNNGDDKWFVNFSIKFNFTFPHERKVDCYVMITASNGESRMRRFPHLCRVENDFEFEGEPFLFGDEQGRIYPGSWVKGGQNITVSNLTVIYSGSPMVYPDDRFFDVKITDSSGRTWWDNASSGEGITIPITAAIVSDPDEQYLITIENIPDSGLCVSNLSFPVKIDAEPPDAPLNLLCHADDFKDRETENTDQRKMYVTWDEVADPASGLLGYYYSSTNNSGTTNGTFITYTQILMEDLDEGYSPVYVWCVDNVGNIGDAAASGILVDLTSPEFSNLTPLDGSWHNHTDVECSAEIWDGEGSGVDGNSIDYSVSAGGRNNFAVWIPAWISTSGNRMIPVITHNFPEGEENYIKWRAKDISGNPIVESTPINIKIDTTPIEFGDVLTPTGNWFGNREITTKIMVTDSGIGVDTDSLEVRISTSGPGNFGDWKKLEKEDITARGPGEFEIAATFTYSEGKANYIMFRGTDLVGNPLAVSDKINLMVDISKVYFTDFTPEEDTASDELDVECYISIMDDGAGVDGTTIEYSVSTDRDDEKEFGPWKRPPNVVAGNPTQVIIQVKFEWGMNNFIRWRGDDKIGTGVNTSQSYRIWTNSEPVISSPESSATYMEDQEIFFDGSDSSDTDGDNLTFFWTSNIAENRILGHDPTFSAALVPGNHTITMFVSDGHGFNVSKRVKLSVGKESSGGGGGGGGGGKDGADLFTKEGKSNFWLYFIIIAAVLFVIFIIVMLLVVRKRKGDDADEVSPMPAAPQSHPYPQGGYQPEMQQGYYQPQYPDMNAAGGGYSPRMAPAYSPAPPYPALPQGPQPAVGNQSLPGPIQGPTYILPAFSTDSGDQNLNMLALPPGPEIPQPGGIPMGNEGMASPLFPGIEGLPPMADSPHPSPTTETPAPAPSGLDGSVMKEFDTFLAAMGSSTGDTAPGTGAEPMQADIMETGDTPAMPMDSTAIPADAPQTPTDLSGMPTDSPSTPVDLASSVDVSATPTNPPTAPQDATPTITEPAEASGGGPAPPPVPDAMETMMQCHACGSNYNVEITSLPTIITCPHCQVQGMIESL